MAIPARTPTSEHSPGPNSRTTPWAALRSSIGNHLLEHLDHLCIELIRRKELGGLPGSPWVYHDPLITVRLLAFPVLGLAPTEAIPLRCKACGAAPPASRALRVAGATALRAALDPGASAVPLVRLAGRPMACPGPCAARESPRSGRFAPDLSTHGKPG